MPRHKKEKEEEPMEVEEARYSPPFKPVKISEVEAAFPAFVVGKLLPAWKDIPENFRNWNSKTEWNDFVGHWFGLGLTWFPRVREGFDQLEVMRHLQACITSFEPKHEHKIAGVAYLMSLWCEPLPKDWRELTKKEKTG